MIKPLKYHSILTLVLSLHKFTLIHTRKKVNYNKKEKELTNVSLTGKRNKTTAHPSIKKKSPMKKLRFEIRVTFL